VVGRAEVSTFGECEGFGAYDSTTTTIRPARRLMYLSHEVLDSWSSPCEPLNTSESSTIQGTRHQVHGRTTKPLPGIWIAVSEKGSVSRMSQISAARNTVPFTYTANLHAIKSQPCNRSRDSGVLAQSKKFELLAGIKVSLPCLNESHTEILQPNRPYPLCGSERRW